MKSPAGLLLSAIELDRASAIPLYRQLYLQIRKQILSGKMQGGVRLPSTRTLSKELALSRITILNAFDQLIAEGFLASRTGAGTYVGNEWESRGIADEEQRQPPRLSDLSQSMLSLRSSHFRGGGAKLIGVDFIEQAKTFRWSSPLGLEIVEGCGYQ